MYQSKRGKFITFEGCDGSGKSTQIEYFKQYLLKHGVPFITTREPGGGKISEAIRAIILDGKNAEMTDECEALLYAAARAQHLKDTVEPALAQGKIVLCDRYYDSSFAYQAAARGLGEEFVAKINAFAIERYEPNATVFINLSARDAFARKHGADENDRLEQAGAAFHDKVYQGFLAQAKKNARRFIVVDGKLSKEEIFKAALKGLQEKGVL